MTDSTNNNNPDLIKQDTAQNIAVKFGLIGGLIIVITSLLLFILNAGYDSWAKWIQTIILTIIIIVGIKKISTNNSYISFGTLFKGGMIISVIIAVLTLLYFFIYVNFIDPDFINNLLEISRKQMLEKGLSDEQIEKAISMSKSFMSPGIMAAISFCSSLILGAFVSLISAAVFKKDKI